MRNSFFWSHTLLKAVSGGYGRLYNFFCTQPQIKVKYGYLYNYFTIEDERGITNMGAHVPSRSEYDTLFINCVNAVDSLRDSNISYWNDSFATNDYNFNGRGSGLRNGWDGGSYMIKSTLDIWCTTISGSNIYIARIIHDGISTSLSFKKTFGFGLRLIVDFPIEINGNSAIYVGNDLRRYKCVLINSVWYLAENLAETKYRNGDLIAKVTDNTAWAALTTGAMCAYNNDEVNAFETASISPVGWHVPTNTEWNTLTAFVGGGATAALHLKEPGLAHWDTDNGNDNSSGFTAFGGGFRNEASTFGGIKQTGKFHSDYIGTYLKPLEMFDELNSAYVTSISGTDRAKVGLSVRLLKNDSTFTPGDTLTDIDGNIYPLVKIGTQVWTASNYKCTKLNDGTPIPNVTDNAQWAALTTGGQCIYNNDIKNL